MKLLLDENLSRRMVPFLLHKYPESTQVALVNLESATDKTIWEYAKANEYVIVTRDADFQEISMLSWQPPKIIWLKIRNASTSLILNILLKNYDSIEQSLITLDNACIEINQD